MASSKGSNEATVLKIKLNEFFSLQFYLQFAVKAFTMPFGGIGGLIGASTLSNSEKKINKQQKKKFDNFSAVFQG